MTFFKTIVQSIYSPKFYKGIPRKPFKKALGYFLLLILFLTLVTVVKGSKKIFFDIPKEGHEMITSANEIYPEDLIIEIKNGEVSINQEEPYFIPAPEWIKRGIIEEGEEAPYLIVIDTTTPFSITQCHEYNALFWLTKDSFLFNRRYCAETRMYNLSGITDFTINKKKIETWTEMILPAVKFVWIPVLIFTIIGLYVGFLSRLLYLVVFALVPYVVGKILKLNFTYGQAYKIGLYALTLALIVNTILSILSKWLPVDGFRYMVSLITTTVVLVNLFGIKKLKSSSLKNLKL